MVRLFHSTILNLVGNRLNERFYCEFIGKGAKLGNNSTRWSIDPSIIVSHSFKYKKTPEGDFLYSPHDNQNHSDV